MNIHSWQWQILLNDIIPVVLTMACFASLFWFLNKTVPRNRK